MNDIVFSEIAPSLKNQELCQKIELAKSDRRELNKLVRDFLPFIKKNIAAVMFRTQSREDCLTEAMLAFARSVQTYRVESGSFASYAKTVIRNRLLDSARSEIASENHLKYAGSEAEAAAWSEEAAQAAFGRQEEEKNLALEIEEVSAEFSEWGFSWAALQKKCPKQERSRKVCQQIARAVLSSPLLLSEMLEKKQLPSTRLSETFPKKAIEKYRLYIIALILIEKGEYPFIYSFVPQKFALEEK